MPGLPVDGRELHGQRLAKAMNSRKYAARVLTNAMAVPQYG